ncbi:hypothetical protein GY45DRAFT_1324320 [Cubamyces sp. BRFM 1775]|nr:hypothetical protein GY45DRAFT_1324320 [Cubamyces sp. BRFM 1775]
MFSRSALTALLCVYLAAFVAAMPTASEQGAPQVADTADPAALSEDMCWPGMPQRRGAVCVSRYGQRGSQ